MHGEDGAHGGALLDAAGSRAVLCSARWRSRLGGVVLMGAAGCGQANGAAAMCWRGRD